MSETPNKIEQITNAGQAIEKRNKKLGFTGPDIMDELGWTTKDEKFYIQNALSLLVRKGRAYKLSKTKPIVYSFDAEAAKLAVVKAKPQPGALQRPSQEGMDGDQPSSIAPFSKKDHQINTLDDFEKIGISTDMVGQAVFRINRSLERKIYDLENELVEVKRKLDDANKRIREQTVMIEKQNQLISGQNQDRQGTVPFKGKPKVIRVKQY